MKGKTGLPYRITGNGEPILFIHGAHIADTYGPLTREPLLADYAKITYRRRGYADSPRHGGPCSIVDNAQDAQDLLAELGIGRAHIVGHSSGGTIALQLALSAPQLVQSLVLLEPALTMVPAADAFFSAVAPLIQLYQSGQSRRAVGEFIALVSGPNWESEIPRMVPGGIEQAVRDASTFFEIELPAVGAWQFDARRAREILQPVLYVLGTESDALFKEGKKLLQAWIPQTEELIVRGANHILQYQNADCCEQVARGISDFCRHYPIGNQVGPER